MKKFISRSEFVAKVDGPRMTKRIEKLVRSMARREGLTRNELVLEGLEAYEALRPIFARKKVAR